MDLSPTWDNMSEGNAFHRQPSNIWHIGGSYDVLLSNGAARLTHTEQHHNRTFLFYDTPVYKQWFPTAVRQSPDLKRFKNTDYAWRRFNIKYGSPSYGPMPFPESVNNTGGRLNDDDSDKKNHNSYGCPLCKNWFCRCDSRK